MSDKLRPSRRELITAGLVVFLVTALVWTVIDGAGANALTSAVSSPVKMPSGLRLRQFQWSCSLGLGCLADGIQKQLSLE